MLNKLKLGHHNQEYADKLAAMSDQALYDEMVEQSVPDDHDGGFTGGGQFLREYSEIAYRERMDYSYYPASYALFNELMFPEGMSRYEYFNGARPDRT